MTNFLKVEQLTFQYDENTPPVLKDISFSIEKGEWVCVLGVNGSGKSTLIHWLMGYLPKKKGIFIYQGKSTHQARAQAKNDMALVLQNPEDQFIGITVRDDLAFGLENACVSYEEMHRRVEEGLQMVAMESYGDCAPHQLSGGQKQKVALAGALILEKPILLLDEATSMLDPEGRKSWLDVLKEQKKKRDCTVISITHNMEEVEYAHKILVLHRGKQLYFGSPKDFFENEALVKESELNRPFSYEVKYWAKRMGLSEEIADKLGWKNEI